jgi:hypothetical protein
MNIDWSNKPEGATHIVADIYGLSDTQKVANERCCYRKKVGGLWFGFENGKWFAINSPEAHRYQKLPVPWTGEGHPLAGTVCELSVSEKNWFEVTVSFIGKELLIAKVDGQEICRELRICRFRPIRTPDQIAAEDLYDRVLSVLRDDDKIREPGRIAKLVVAAISDVKAAP